ncbi:hypothetical protein D3273_03065 [Lichenibacterium minor]|uniref:Uncharacterized protein n=1 Tax=Lichenibacterium minor TaxID=2316528 RepID=A0A4Q2UE20_9HYPH|nr:hypothetical protein [Lichenibacterium minor]RYC33467.1 hypothetical protein D3273_03065 [Lichenibacterium minor]
MCEEVIRKTVEDLRAEADVDFIDVSFIAESLREDLDLKNQSDIRRHTLEVIGRLMMQGVYPGDYDYAATLAFWSGEPSEHLKRIEAEWIAMGRTPTSVEPICWLGLKSAVISLKNS